MIYAELVVVLDFFFTQGTGSLNNVGVNPTSGLTWLLRKGMASRH
jgi:hypothetical protein